MKATVNGTTIEGTPQEIAEYQRLQQQEEAKKPPYKSHLPDNLWKGAPNTSGSTRAINCKCPNETPCFCTGACTGTKQIADANNSYGAMAVVSLSDLFKASYKNTQNNG